MDQADCPAPTPTRLLDKGRTACGLAKAVCLQYRVSPVFPGEVSLLNVGQGAVFKWMEMPLGGSLTKTF